MSQKTRSSLKLDAVASAAALGSARALNPLRKLATLGALAGFVLHLFRTKEQAPAGLKRSRAKGERKQSEGNMGGLNHG